MSYFISTISFYTPYTPTPSFSLQHTDITLPEDFVCDECILQLLRNAAEWGTSSGQPYLFWTCSDITIVNSE